MNQGTKVGTLKKPMFSLFDVISFLFNGKEKKKFRARLPVSNIWNNGLPRIIAFPRIIVPGHYSSNDTVGSTTFYFWPKQNVPQPLLFSPRSFWKNNLALASSSWSSTRSGESCKLPQPHQCNRTRRKWFRDSWFHHLMTGAVYQWFKISLMVWKPSGKVVDADNDAMTNGANRRRNTAGQRWTAIVLNRGRG